MDKISFELQREINSRPFGEFDVIITLMEGVNAESLNLKNYRGADEQHLGCQTDCKRSAGIGTERRC